MFSSNPQTSLSDPWSPPKSGDEWRRSSSPMRVLYFAPKECWPPNTGARLRNYYLARELARHAPVTYLGFAEDGGLRQENAEPCQRVVTVARPHGYSLTQIARGIIGRTPLPVLNYTTPLMAQTLARLLDEQNFDVVQMEGIHLIAYLPIIRAARHRPLVICDWHNIESEIMQRYSQHAPSLARRLYARMTTRHLASIEFHALSLFDAHLVVSERDRVRLLELAPEARVFVIENGVDAAFYSDAGLAASGGLQFATPRRHRVLFVGSMDYHANVDAAVRFARECWPSVYRQRPELTFTIVGRHPRPEVRALAQLPGIEVTGTVDDVRPYFREALVEVVPLRIGGGSRLKILEAMAAGVPVISTRLGAEGLAVKDSETITFAETADDFCRALCDLDEGQRAWRKQADAARTLARERYDWPMIGAALREAHLRLTSRAASLEPAVRQVMLSQTV